MLMTSIGKMPSKVCRVIDDYSWGRSGEMLNIQLVPMVIQKWWPSLISSSNPATDPSHCQKALGKVFLAFISSREGVRAGKRAREQGAGFLPPFLGSFWVSKPYHFVSLETIYLHLHRPVIFVGYLTVRFHWYYFMIEPCGHILRIYVPRNQVVRWLPVLCAQRNPLGGKQYVFTERCCILSGCSYPIWLRFTCPYPFERLLILVFYLIVEKHLSTQSLLSPN